MQPGHTASQTFRVVLGLASCLLFAEAGHAQSAQSEPEFYSLKEWAPVQTWQLVAIPAVVAATIGISTVNVDNPRWTGGILFDNGVRGALRLQSASARSHAASASDYLLYGVSILPFLIDAGVLTGVVHKRMDLAWQMFVLDAEAITLTAFVDTSTKRIAGRQRPDVPECQINPTLPDCSSSGKNFSFFSGHTAIASTAATLRCLQHFNLHLYGNDLVDGAACGVAIAAATTTGLLRVMSDSHYITDVLAGAAVGVGSAFLVYAIHVRPMANGERPIPISLHLRRDFLGVTYGFAF
jgi:membrane-associated phospholipid phosphatase